MRFSQFVKSMCAALVVLLLFVVGLMLPLWLGGCSPTSRVQLEPSSVHIKQVEGQSSTTVEETETIRIRIPKVEAPAPVEKPESPAKAEAVLPFPFRAIAVASMARIPDDVTVNGVPVPLKPGTEIESTKKKTTTTTSPAKSTEGTAKGAGGKSEGDKAQLNANGDAPGLTLPGAGGGTGSSFDLDGSAKSVSGIPIWWIFAALLGVGAGVALKFGRFSLASSLALAAAGCALFALVWWLPYACLAVLIGVALFEAYRHSGSHDGSVSLLQGMKLAGVNIDDVIAKAKSVAEPHGSAAIDAARRKEGV